MNLSKIPSSRHAGDILAPLMPENDLMWIAMKC
jgi:hypothetical protein